MDLELEALLAEKARRQAGAIDVPLDALMAEKARRAALPVPEEPQSTPEYLAKRGARGVSALLSLPRVVNEAIGSIPPFSWVKSAALTAADAITPGEPEAIGPGTTLEDLRREYIGDPEQRSITSPSRWIGAGIEAAPFALLGGGVPLAMATGVGSEAAAEVAPESAALQIAAPILTGGIYKGITSGATALKNVFSPAVATAQARQQAKEVASKFISPETVIQKAQALKAAEAKIPLIQRQSALYLPKYKTSAEVFGHPGAALLEQSLAKSTPELQTAIAGKDLLRQQAQRALVEKTKQASSEGASTILRNALEEGLDLAKGKVSEFANKAFSAENPIPISRAKAAATSTINKLTKVSETGKTGKTIRYAGPSKPSADLQKSIDNFKALPKEASLETIQRFRSAWGTYANAGRQYGAGTAEKVDASIANALRKSVDTAIDKSIPASQKNAYRKMIKLRTEQGVFEADNIGEALAKKQFGSYEVEDSQLMASLIKKPEDTTRLLSALKKVPNKADVIKTVRASKIDDLIGKSSKEVVEGDLSRQIFLPATYSKELKKTLRETGDLLTKNQKAVLQYVDKDLKSKLSVRELASKASASQSVSAQDLTVIGELTKTIEAASTSALRRVPVVKELIDTLSSIVGKSAEKKKALVLQELVEFAKNPYYASNLMRTPTAQNVSNVAKDLKAALLAGATMGAGRKETVGE